MSPRSIWLNYAAAIALCVPPALAQLGPLPKGHAWFIENGFQLQGLSTNFDPWHLGTFQNANYTAVNWLWDSSVAQQGAAPGAIPWARWVRNQGEMPPIGAEGPYMGKLIALSLGDEPELNNPTIRDDYVNWFNAVAPSYPNQLLYMNNYGGQVTDGPLGDFITRAHPDMISFDTYPYRYIAPNNPVPVQPAGGSPTNWYGDLRRYRQHAVGSDIPLGMYRQTYHSTSEGVRDTSDSELRLMTFGAMAFNVKYLTDFTYNSGASPMYGFAGGGGGTNAYYDSLKETNRLARNMGSAMVRLKPVSDPTVPSHTSSMVFVRGRYTDATTYNAIPIGFIQDGASVQYTDWTFGQNDPYLSGFTTVTNLGTKNDGLRGDMIISWFKPLDEWFDGDDWNNEVYMMVVNGLADMNGTVAETRQSVNLDFNNHAVTQTIQVLDPNTGLVSDVALPLVSTKRRYTLTLDGGTGILLKFKTGAPFVGTMPTDAIWTSSSSGGFQTAGNWDTAAVPGAGNFIHYGSTTSGAGPMYTSIVSADVSVKGAFVHRDNVMLGLSGHTLALTGFPGVDSLIVGMNTGETGSLTISAGSLNVAANPGYFSQIGKAAGATGTVTLSGGATWVNTPDVLVGKLGTGTMRMLGGSGTFSSVYLGGSPTAAGGTGAMNIFNATVNVSGTLKLWDAGDIVMQTGGSLTAANIQMAGGDFVRAGGSLAFTNFTQTGGSSSLGAVTGNAVIVVGGANNPHMGVDNLVANTLTINNQGTVSVAPGNGATASKLNSLTINTVGTLNLNDSSLVINYSGGSPLATIAAQIGTGYSGSVWTGPGIQSSAAAATAGSSHVTALGFAEASNVFTTFPATFLNQSVDNTSLLIRYTFAGDFDLSGTVDSVDFNLLAASFGQSGKRWFNGDSTYEGTVDSVDFNLLAANFGQTIPSSPALGSLIPEPSVLAPAGCALALLLRRRGLLRRSP